ncbi:hypothetical protein [Brachybacterium aquaticum]|uniref:Uncharacterized protein n=1 Tax=Brachybacterium aquaticum TaxID=1432564 RepID=A0A841AGZ5_9MICO|nr:hypothetical protein [Brachybacterium aquaticum]MBB5832560.1 hypothetical protein [Brachybacterium aquaticum]
MLQSRLRAGVAGLLLAPMLLLSACTEGSYNRCSGAHHEMSCAAGFSKSTSQWSEKLTGDHWHTQIVVSGTFTVEAGSGTLTLSGADGEVEYPLSPEAPVAISDLALDLNEPFGNDSPTRTPLSRSPRGPRAPSRGSRRSTST